MKDILIKNTDSKIYTKEVSHIACQTLFEVTEDITDDSLVSLRMKVLQDFANKLFWIYSKYKYSMPNSLLLYKMFEREYEYTTKFHEPSNYKEGNITDTTEIAKFCVSYFKRVYNVGITEDEVLRFFGAGEFPFIYYGAFYYEENKQLVRFYRISR